MRILGFSEKWDKLKKSQFTTFRFPRKDKDWYVGEQVQVFYKPRSKNREYLGVAEIVDKEIRLFDFNYGGSLYKRADREAIEDGFISIGDMLIWITKKYGYGWRSEPMNKFTLRWVIEFRRIEG